MDGRDRVLLVEDDGDLRRGLARYLRVAGYEAVEAPDIAEARRHFESQAVEAVILDIGLPDGSGLDLLGECRERSPSTPVLVLTGNASIDAAVECIKRGAENFLTKPVDTAALLLILERAIGRRDLKMRALRSAATDTRPDPFRGSSAAVRALQKEATRLLATDRPVLLLGETGTGKGVLARWLHEEGPRAREAFVDLNCAGLSRDLLESELFGHEAGAFTGASRRKVGLLEEAHRGTVFLDELAEMDLNVQARLLKAVEDRKIRPLGGTREKAVDFRLIAATHRDLRALVAEGKFREDLFFRLSAFPLKLPPLRERADDIAGLAASLLTSFAAELGRPGLRLPEGALEALISKPWRGNIRELRNTIERAALYSDGDVLDARLFASVEDPLEHGAEASMTLEELERRHVSRVMKAERNRVAPAARRLGIARSSLYEKLRRYGVAFSENEEG